MEIVSVHWERLKIPLKKPFRIALGTSDFYEGVIVKICTEEFCGYGEAAPSPRITGETVESVIGALEKMHPYLLGKNPLEIGKIMSGLDRLIKHNTSAKAAVDFALHDILGKKADAPLKTLIGGIRDKIPTSLTVDICKPDEAVKMAENLISAGAQVLKVKIGLNPEEDIERVKAIRSITDIPIRVDANQGYSLKQAIKVLRSIEKYDIEFAEQPLPADRIDELEILRKNIAIPVIADESVHTATDVIRLIGKVDGINIKLMKSGGIHEAIKMASIAKAAGMEIMVGCMIETHIGIAAGTHFALGIGADYADLDGYWDLEKQPFEGVIYREGFNYVRNEPGLGITAL